MMVYNRTLKQNGAKHASGNGYSSCILCACAEYERQTCGSIDINQCKITKERTRRILVGMPISQGGADEQRR
jgi:hypothetical protein